MFLGSRSCRVFGGGDSPRVHAPSEPTNERNGEGILAGGYRGDALGTGNRGVMTWRDKVFQLDLSAT